MSVTLQLPDVRRIIGDLQRRVGILERRISARAAVQEQAGSITFAESGDVTETSWPPIRFRQEVWVAVLAVTLGTAGDTDVIIDVKRNGTTVATITVPDGVTIYNGEVNARFAAEADVFILTVTDAGGAADITAEARY